MAACFLRIGADYLDDSKRFNSNREAVESFEDTARELARYGQNIDGSIHIARNRAELVEYPDYILSIGPKGGIRKERA